MLDASRLPRRTLQILLLASAVTLLAGLTQAQDRYRRGAPPQESIEERPDSAFDPDWGQVGVFAAALECGSCHQASPTVPWVMMHEGLDVSPFTGWRHSMMANAFVDPYFQAKMADETAMAPHLAGLIEDKCLTCHAPMGRTHARQTGSGLDPEGYYRLDTALNQMHTREGVSCTVCHQIQSDNFGSPESYSGGYEIDPALMDIHGPYPSPRGALMFNQTGFNAVFDPNIEDSALCATCHTLYTPVVDINTNQPNGAAFPEQTPYFEWQNSIYSPESGGDMHCQDCHMPQPAPDYSTVIATRNGDAPGAGWPERHPFHRHALIGGNTHMLEILGRFKDRLGLVDTEEAAFEAKEADSRFMLQTASATVELLDSEPVGNALIVPVRITNLTGHKLPTGYPSRRMWVHFKAMDRNGFVIFESGAHNDAGELSVDALHGRTTCLNPYADHVIDDPGACFEPHRTLITRADQVAIYESVAADVNDRVTFGLIHASHYLKDNRIPPIGFDRNLLPSDGASDVIGDARQDANFSPDFPSPESGRDTVRYRIPAGNWPGPLRVEVRVLYQSIRPTFVDSLQAVEERAVSEFRKMHAIVPPTPEVLATAVREFDHN